MQRRSHQKVAPIRRTPSRNGVPQQKNNANIILVSHVRASLRKSFTKIGAKIITGQLKKGFIQHVETISRNYLPKEA